MNKKESITNNISSFYRQDRIRYITGNRLQWHEPSFWAVTIYRYGQWCKYIRLKWFKKILLLFYWPLYAAITIVTGINLPNSTKIGPGLRVWHFGCIVLHPDVIIGENCDIRHGVTIGNRQHYYDVPIIGNNVNIGAGAKIIGKIKVGNNVKIGANAVVVRDVPDNHIAVGIPAKNLPIKELIERK